MNMNSQKNPHGGGAQAEMPRTCGKIIGWKGTRNDKDMEIGAWVDQKRRTSKAQELGWIKQKDFLSSGAWVDQTEGLP
jgi:hypothetical protein